MVYTPSKYLVSKYFHEVSDVKLHPSTHNVHIVGQNIKSTEQIIIYFEIKKPN